MIRDSERGFDRKSEIRGCVDLGSSNFRLLVLDAVFPDSAKEEAGALEIRSIGEEKRFVGWGDDLAASGSISPEKLETAIRATRDLIASAERRGCPRPALVATNTLREAVDAARVKARLEETAGAPIRVLTQREEAELGYVGASFFRPRGESVLLVDAGGTSTEISWGTGTTIEGCLGLPVGTHRVRRILDRSSCARRVSAALAERIAASAAAERGGADGVYSLPGFPRNPTMLMTGGTAVSLGVLCGRMSGQGTGFEEMRRIARGDLALVTRRLAGLYRAKRQRSLPFDPGRIALLPAGLALIDALVRSVGIESFTVTARDLRWGRLLTGGASE
jgi:exopolyphosphatase/guanosine-5'-triphosphate,3'-diphosphate pyrophosphatase